MGSRATSCFSILVIIPDQLFVERQKDKPAFVLPGAAEAISTKVKQEERTS